MARTSSARRSAASTGPDAPCVADVIGRLSSRIHPHEGAGDPLTNPGGHPADGTAPQGFDRVRSAYRFLAMNGLSPIEAGNVVAWMAGLHSASGGWRVAEIESLVLLRSLVECGRISP